MTYKIGPPPQETSLLRELEQPGMMFHAIGAKKAVELPSDATVIGAIGVGFFITEEDGQRQWNLCNEAVPEDLGHDLSEVGAKALLAAHQAITAPLAEPASPDTESFRRMALTQTITKFQREGHHLLGAVIAIEQGNEVVSGIVTPPTGFRPRVAEVFVAYGLGSVEEVEAALGSGSNVVPITRAA